MSDLVVYNWEHYSKFDTIKLLVSNYDILLLLVFDRLHCLLLEYGGVDELHALYPFVQLCDEFQLFEEVLHGL